MHFVFYSERDTKIILIVNFVLRRIPGKAAASAPVGAWRPGIVLFPGWPEGADSLGHAACVGVFRLAGGVAEAHQPAARVQPAPDRLHPGAGAAGSGPRRGRPQVQLWLGLQEGNHPGPHRVSRTWPRYSCYYLPQRNEADFLLHVCFLQDTGWQRVQNSSVSGKALQRSSVGGLHDSSGVPLHW